MANLPQAIETDLCRIILFSSSGTKLLFIPESGGLRLPALRVPRYQRLAENLTASLQSEWSQQAVCLLRLDSTSAPSGAHYHVMETCEENPPDSTGSRWICVSSLVESQFQEGSDYAAVTKSLSECQDCVSRRKHGPFARFGWFSELTSWIRHAVASEGLTLSGRFTQLNASPAFSLVRFETNGPALWFKAVGEPNLREYPITLALSKYCPGFLPQLLSTHEDWNGWLMLEAEGVHLDGSSPLKLWAAVATTLAHLQIASMGQTLHLADAGCRDARVPALAELVEPFLEVMADLMEQQTKQIPPPVSRKELLALRTKLQDLLSETRDPEIPSTIGHLDFNPGNIVVSRDRCAFLDWAEACIGHPFLTFQYLLEHCRALRGKGNSAESSLTAAYAGQWRPFLSEREISRALKISPLLAVFAYAARGDAWRDVSRRNQPGTARQLRSLTRRIKGEADRLVSARVSRGTPCLR